MMASPSSMTTDNRSAVFWFGMVAIVGSASLNGRLSQRRPTTKGFAVLCDPASGCEWMGRKGYARVEELGGRLAVPVAADETARERGDYVSALPGANSTAYGPW